MPTGWRAEVLQAVDFWLAAEERGGTRQAGWKELGRARPASETGWYTVDLRGTNVGPDQLDRLRLAGPEGPASGSDGSETAGWAVQDTLMDGGVLRVRVADVADVTQPRIWAYRQPSGFLVKALHDGISAMKEPGLADLLARRQPGGRPARDAPGTTPFGLLPPQAAAYRAALGTGVWLVWGPPGTGKTQVLRHSIESLLERGNRILLVSATNIAVDNALQRVIDDERGMRPGRIVRVGTPHLPEVQRNEAVSLPHLVRVKLDHLEQRRGTFEEQIRPLREQAEQLAFCEERIAGFEHAAYLDAIAITGSEPNERYSELSAQVSAAYYALEIASDDGRRAKEAARRSASAFQLTASARAVWAEVDALHGKVQATEDAAVAAEAEALRAATAAEGWLTHLHSWSAQGAVKRMRSKAERERLESEHTLAANAAARSRADALGARNTVNAYRVATQRRIDELSRTASYARSDIAVLETAAREAEREQARAAAEIDAASGRHDAAKESMHAFLAAMSVVRTEQQRKDDRPSTAALVAQLRPRVLADQPRLNDLTAQYAKVEAEYERLARDAAGEIIRSAQLVATTLARFRTTKAVLDGKYDAVFIDECSAAMLPEILLAVSKAGSMAMLLGDFMQLGAVGVDEFRTPRAPETVKTWLVPDVFAHCEITTADRARAQPACITLDTQHRFGLDIMDLANRVAYDGILQAGSRPQRVGHGTTEHPQIVLVDTDGLGDIERIYLSPGKAVTGWWPAGTLLSRAIADLHVAQGEAVGIVTPYKPQFEATLEAIRDAERGETILAEVGTAHRFQGREFPIVVFDTVENRDGRGRDGGWMAGASLTGGDWKRGGVQLFNVAATRAQQTLYILASRSAVERAKESTPFAHLRRQIAEKHSTVVRAADFTRPGYEPPVEYGALGAELVEVLGRHVEVLALDDERTFYDGFLPRIQQARESIWLWAPWVKARLDTVLPALRAAEERGVRVVVFVRSDRDTVHKADPSHWEELRRTLRNVVFIENMHQKIAVFDEQQILYGSLNALSSSLNPRGRNRETMLTLNGHTLAQRILQAEHAEEFSKSRRCGGCGGTLGEIRRYQKERGWWWNCLDPGCAGRSSARPWRIKVAD